MPYGIVLSHNTEAGAVETIASPEAIAKVLSNLDKPLAWDTGLLAPNTLFVAQRGRGRIVVEYRKPQWTGIWLEGSDEAVRLPMPGMLLFRLIPDDERERPRYALFAVKRRPTNPAKTKLYNMPLPNTYADGNICWGTVAAPPRAKLDPVKLDADWAVLLGSKFGDHSVSGKSKANPTDIRKQLIALHNMPLTGYPMADLQPSTRSLVHMLKSWEG